MHEKWYFPEELILPPTIEGQAAAITFEADWCGFSMSLITIPTGHPSAPMIKLDTPTRQDFLRRNSEAESQIALERLARETILRTGGFVNIHPFYGAVWGTKLTPVSPGFLTDLPNLDESLSIFIYVNNQAGDFNDELTKAAKVIGNVFVSGTSRAAAHRLYNESAAQFPNQRHRDQAITNGLGQKWDKEFVRIHRDLLIPQAIELTPWNTIQLIGALGEVGLKHPRVTDFNWQ